MRRAIIGAVDAKNRNWENIHPDVYAVLELWQKIFLKPEVREKIWDVINDIPELKDFADKFGVRKQNSQRLIDNIQKDEQKKWVKELKKQFEWGWGDTDDDDDDDE